MKTEMLSNQACVNYINGRLHLIKELIADESKFDSITKETVDKQFEKIKEYLSVVYTRK
tara:strand:- start:553 stop:729 length:177 start_codon:yes stop_codon:yes gene_type:complete